MSDEPSNGESRLGVDRRAVLAGVAAAGAAVALSGCESGDTTAAPQPALSQKSDFELQEVSISELQEGMASGRWTSRAITDLYLGRIQELDRQGPELRSVIETNPDAVAIAEQLDQERAGGKVRSPLHGVPILLKDNIATADRNTTTAGSLALEGSIPPKDAFIAGQLRAAGAVLLGKANLSEWANFRSTRSSSGWSARGGQCRNPYSLDRNPCGSSAGSGAATSASLCAAAIGTETNGSIVCPSNANGLVGIKPTVGLVSRSGIIPISHTQDTAGPMARTVRDAVLLLNGIVGVDREDRVTRVAAEHAEVDYSGFLDAAGLAGARIGLARQFLSFHPQVDEAAEAAVQALRDRGAEVIDPVEIKTRRAISKPSFQVLLYEFKAGMRSYLAGLGSAAPVQDLAGLIAFNQQNRDREMPYFGQELFEQAQEKGDLSEPEYRKSLSEALRLARDEGIDATMDEHRLDAIIAPTGGPAWVTDLVNGDHFSGGSSSAAAVAGYPNITVPMGSIRGLPVGLSFFGRAWSEPTLLRIAYAFEQATQHRRAPRFLPTLDLRSEDEEAV